MTFIYSNILGTFVLDNSLSIIEKKLFKSAKEDFNQIQNIISQEISKIEQEFIKKYPNAKYLGFKNSKDLPKTQDIKIYEKASENLKLKNVRKFSITLTKKQLKELTHRDNLIIQSINTIEDLKKIANLMIKRFREWYELHNPEYSHHVEDQEKFIQAIKDKSRKELLEEISIEEEDSMGMDLKQKDLKPLNQIIKEINNIYKLIDEQEIYIKQLMDELCPNLDALAGSLIGAKLIAQAGSLRKLSLFPASTIQLLGAEKALFRHIKNKKAKPPKHGVIINHPLVNDASLKDKGKVARALADKISIAVKIDVFKGEFIGDKLLKGLEDRFNQKNKTKNKTK